MFVTTVLFIRHAVHALLPHTLVGRADGVSLSPEGREQARRLGEILAHQPVAVVQSSPRDRARQTAAAIAVRHVLPVETVPALDEMDFGSWTGMRLAELDIDPNWHAWNIARAQSCPPQGETMQALQDRVVRHLKELQDLYPHETVVLVSHAEPIRAALLHARGMHLNDYHRIEVPPGSITKLELGARSRRAFLHSEVHAA
jgi:probable phosphoglycerate mutase